MIAKDKIPKNKPIEKYANLYEKNFKALINTTKVNFNKIKDTLGSGRILNVIKMLLFIS